MSGSEHRDQSESIHRIFHSIGTGVGEKDIGSYVSPVSASLDMNQISKCDII